VKRDIEIVLVDQGDGGTLYSLLFAGEKETELEKFLHSELLHKENGFMEIAQRLYNMTDSSGFREQFFEMNEGLRTDSVAALKKGRIRLYCLRWSSTLVIVGTGGIKTAQTYQKDIALGNIVPELQEIDKLILKRQRSGEIEIDHDTGEMSGNLTFTSEDIL
jgi:hypothetical protein